MIVSPFAYAAHLQGTWAWRKDVTELEAWKEGSFGHRWRCERCLVEWTSFTGSKDADVCWLCQGADESKVWAFNGRPWSYSRTPTKGMLV